MILALADSFSVPLYAKGLDCRYYWCNSAFCDFIGKPRKFIIGASVHDVAPDKDTGDIWYNKDKEILKTLETQEYVYSRLDKDSKSLQYFYIKKKIIYDIDKSVSGIAGAIIEITEQIKAENNFRLMFDMAPIPIALTDIETGKILKFNKEWERVSGYNSNEIMGHTIFDLDLNRLQPELCESKISDTSHKVNFSLKSKSGKIIYGVGNAVTVSYDDKLACLSAIIDMSERVESEERFETLFNVVPVPILITNLEDGVILDINQSGEKFLGSSRFDIIGKTSFDFNIWNSTDKRDSVISKIKDKSITSLTIQIATKSRVKDVEVAITLIRMNGQDLLVSVVTKEYA